MKSEIRRRRIISALQVGFVGDGGDGGPSSYAMYASTSKALFLGNGSFAYPAFGGLAIQQSPPYRMSCAFVLGSGHNVPPYGNIMNIYSGDGFETYEDHNGVANQMETVTVSGGVLYSNPVPFYTSTGRLIIFYAGNYLKYSDAPGVWSSQITINPSGPPFVGPGQCIELADHTLLMTMQDVNGPTGCYMWESPDMGETWTQRSVMFNPALNFDEATAGLLINNDIFAMYRDNSTKKIWVNRSPSPSLGAAFSAPINTGIDAQSKAPFAISPNGNLFGMSRYPVAPFETIYLTASGDATDLASQGPIDAREGANMYGGCVWHPGLNKGIGVRFMEVYGTTTHIGPCLIIKTDFFESTTPIAPPTYEVHYQSSLDCSQAQPRGYTLPDDVLKAKQNALIEALNSNGISWDRLWLFANGDSGLGNWALTNLHFPSSETPTLIGGPPYSASGYDFNGTTQRIDLGLSGRLNVSISYLRDDAGLFYYTPDTGIDAAFGRNFGVTAAFLISHASDGLLYWRINCGTNSTITAPTGVKRYFLQRRSSTDKRIWANGTQRGAVSVPSVSIAAASDNINIGCINNGGGSFNNFSNKGCGIFMMGGANIGKEADLDQIFVDYIVSIGGTP